MDYNRVVDYMRMLIAAIGISKDDLYPDDEEELDEDDDVSLLMGKPGQSVSHPSATKHKLVSKPTPSSSGMLEELKKARSWDGSGARISQVMGEGEAPVFEEANASLGPNEVDMTVDVSDIDDDVGGFNI